MRWRRRSTASRPVCAMPGENLVNGNAGRAGALARRDPRSDLLFGRYAWEAFRAARSLRARAPALPAERLSRFFGQGCPAFYQLIKNILLTGLQARCINTHT